VVRQRAILVGVGGFGSVWVSQFLPAFADRIEVVGLVDVDRATLDRAGDRLGVDPARRFIEMETAFAQIDADFCILVIQPFLRWRAVNLAIGRGLPILAEKPIADTWGTSLDILHLTRAHDVKMGIVQNYPFTNRIRTVKRLLDAGTLGRINYIVARFAADYTIHSAGGAFRHQVPYAMLFEGAVHHFDQLRNLAGADGALVSGLQWNPPWSTFGNPPTALFQIEMANGIVCQYELNHLAKGVQNGWHHERYRVECEFGVIEVGADGVVRTIEHLGGGRLRTTEIETVTDEPSGHHAVIADFLNWLEGSTAPETAIEDNIYTAALVFSAVEAVQTRSTVDIAAKVKAAGLTPAAARFSAAPLPSRGP